MVGMCPFYLYEKKGYLFCEGVTVKYPDKETQYVSKMRYCCNEEHGFMNCSVYKELNEYYNKRYKGDDYPVIKPSDPEYKRVRRSFDEFNLIKKEMEYGSRE